MLCSTRSNPLTHITRARYLFAALLLLILTPGAVAVDVSSLPYTDVQTRQSFGYYEANNNQWNGVTSQGNGGLAIYISQVQNYQNFHYAQLETTGSTKDIGTEGDFDVWYIRPSDNTYQKGLLRNQKTRDVLGRVTKTVITFWPLDGWAVGTKTGAWSSNIYADNNGAPGSQMYPTGTTWYLHSGHPKIEGDDRYEGYLYFTRSTNYGSHDTRSHVEAYSNDYYALKIEDAYASAKITLTRVKDGVNYPSTITIADSTGAIVFSDTQAVDISTLVAKNRLRTITVTSGSKTTTYNLYLDGIPPPPALYGDVVDVYTGAPISGATITATQSTIGRTLTTTSDANGEYLIDPTIGLVPDHPVTITANAPGYTQTSLSFQAVPRYTEWYVPLLMVPTTAPDVPIEEGKTMLYGYVVTAGSSQPISGATITIDGIGSTTTSSTGFYVFNNVTPGTYSLSASATQHDTLSESVIVDAAPTQHNLALAGHYTLIVTVKDSDSLKILTNATTISLSDGQERNDQNPASFAVDYGQYTILAAAEGYAPTQQYQYIDRVGDTQATILLSPKPVPPTPPELPNYPPHNVKFTVQTLLGTPIPGVTVTAQGIQQTPSTNIIERLLGLNTTSTPITTELMSGTTDSNGEINFMMIEAVKYRISFYKPDVVDQTLEIYPKEDTYPIIISTAGGPLLPDAGDALRDIRINVTTSTEGDIGHIHIDYNDTTRKTTGLSIQVTQQNTTNTSAPEDVIATYTVANDANVTHTFDLPNYKGQSFFVRLEAEHPDFGTINRDYAVAFKGVRVPLGSLPDGLYIYVAGFGLMLLGGIFGATSATRGVVVIALAGWLFWGFGWLDDLGLIAPVSLSLVSTLAVMGVIVTRYREEGYS